MGNKLIQPVAASDIARWCGINLVGEDMLIRQIAPLSESVDGVLCFATTAPTQAGTAQVALMSTADAKSVTTCLLETDHPRLAFARALNAIQKNVGFEKPDTPPKIHPTAQVSAQAFVALGAVIGARTIVLPFAYIGEDTVIGDDCVIKSGAVIGQDGFGFERDENNLPLRIIHLGRVVIGNNVEIGSLTTVCRGTLANTIVDDYVKTDDHVHIAHNCHIRKGALLTACVELSGGVDVGSFSWIGPNSSVMQKIKIGTNSLIGMAANVTKNVPDGVVVAGNPAKILHDKN